MQSVGAEGGEVTWTEDSLTKVLDSLCIAIIL